MYGKMENVNMSGNMSIEAKAVIQYIIAHPRSSENRIYHEVKSELERAHAQAQRRAHTDAKKRKVKFETENITFNRIFVMRKVNMLQSRGFLWVEKGPRNAKLCWLTFRGLMYAIQNGIIEAKDAGTIEAAHKLKQKIICYRLGGPEPTVCQRPGSVDEFKQQYPEIFFNVLSRLPNILQLDEKDIGISNLSCFATFLGGFYRYLTDEKYYVDCQSEQEHFQVGCFGACGHGEIPFTFIMETLLKTLGFKLPDPPFYKRPYPELDEPS
jgi:hypothetical protein